MNTKPLLIASAVFNALLVSVFIYALCNPSPGVAYEKPPDGTASAAAFVITTDNAGVTFGPAFITMKAGQSVTLQVSVVHGGGQSNYMLDLLYDRKVITAAKTKYGVKITAKAPGTCIVQYPAPGGIKDFAFVKVEP
jgi:hypothetical protein